MNLVIYCSSGYYSEYYYTTMGDSRDIDGVVFIIVIMITWGLY